MLLVESFVLELGCQLQNKTINQEYEDANSKQNIQLGI
jgi:hypothetical protein